jgi:acetyl esterase/lipase
MLGVLLAGGMMLMMTGRGAAAGPADPNAASGRYPAEVFAALPAIESPEIAPNGAYFAAKIDVKGTQYFAITPFSGERPRIIALGELDLNWWRWVDDEWLVMGIGQTTDVMGEDWYVRRIVGVNTAGKLVRLSPLQSGQNADNVIWFSHDGKPRVRLAYQTSIFYDEPGFWPQVDEIDVATGRHRQVQASQKEVTSWYSDGNGAIRMGLGHGNNGRSTRVLYRPGERGLFHTIDSARTPKEAVMAPALFLPDGGALMIADDEDGYSALYDLDLASMKRGAQRFASKGFDIGGLIVDRAGFALEGVSVNEDRPAIRWIDPEMKAMAEEAQAMVKGSNVHIESTTADRQQAIIKVDRPNAPGLYFRFDRKAKTVMDLGQINETIGMRGLNPVRTIRYKAGDGLEIAAVLTVPRGAGRNLPLVVLPHGGPFARDTEEWDWWTQFIASRGYAVIQPNYRGSSGYGTAFARKGEGQWGLAMQDDLNDAIIALAKDGIADPKRVCMVGASYGGYAAMRAAQRDGALYRCAVSYAGVSDLPAMKRYDARFLMSGVRGDWLKTQAPDLAAVSPINGARDFSIPILLFHGAKDRTVPVRQSRSLNQKLAALGKTVTYVEQPEGDHHFSRSEDRLQFLKALEAFLARYNPA